MKLMEIESNVLINLDLVEKAELKQRSGKTALIVTIGGKETVVTKDPGGLFQLLIKMSMEREPIRQYTAV